MMCKTGQAVPESERNRPQAAQLQVPLDGSFFACVGLVVDILSLRFKI